MGVWKGGGYVIKILAVSLISVHKESLIHSHIISSSLTPNFSTVRYKQTSTLLAFFISNDSRLSFFVENNKILTVRYFSSK